MLTIFTFGYWGWGNSTFELIHAMDRTERERGYRLPFCLTSVLVARLGRPVFAVRHSRSSWAVGGIDGFRV
jgi:hypothetical protein